MEGKDTAYVTRTAALSHNGARSSNLCNFQFKTVHCARKKTMVALTLHVKEANT